MRSITSGVSCAVCVMAIASCLVGATIGQGATIPVFQGLGDLAGGGFSSQAYAVSTDGSVIVGAGTSASGTEAFRWTRTGGMVGLGDLAGGAFHSVAYAVSGDGAVVVGDSSSAYSYAGPYRGNEAFRWTAADGMVGLAAPDGPVESAARGVSSDGSVVVGSANMTGGSGNFPAIWTSAGDLQSAPYLFGKLYGITPDASVVVGEHYPYDAVRWSESDGIQTVASSTASQPIATAVNADGSVVVGVARGEPGATNGTAFRWTSDGGLQFLGDLPGGAYHSVGKAVSADGQTVVGSGWTGTNYFNQYDAEAFIWDPTRGMRSIEDVLTNEWGLGDGLAGWRLCSATGISADGNTIVGWGVNPAGQNEAWMASIPEPSAVLMWLTGGLSLLVYRVVRRR